MLDMLKRKLDFGAVSVELDERVAVITIDNPPVNAASFAVRRGIAQALDALEALETGETQEAVEAIVLACFGKTFIAGADIREFDAAPVQPILPDVAQRIEAFPIPIVAAIQGSALGAGAEIALACHARVMAVDACFGFPEVKLGLIPGAGGTQRLPRLIGLSALDILCAGETVSAQEALRLGFADQVHATGLVEAARECALSLVGTTLRRTGWLPLSFRSDPVFEENINALRVRYKRSEAVSALLDVLYLSPKIGIKDAYEFERKTFLRLKGSDQARALRHLFFAERKAGKLGAEVGAGKALTNIGVVGAGLMGTGIAIACLDAGYHVTLTDTSIEALGRAKEKIQAHYKKLVARGKLAVSEVAARQEALVSATTILDLKGCDLVIEAIIESADAKIGLFTALDQIVSRDAILATNTSYLDVAAIARATRVPSRVIGLHFFSPANIMRLVEVVQPETADLSKIATGVKFARSLRKTPVITGVCDGFIGNRLFSTWRRQVEFMVEEGALPHEIDAALEAYGFAMGPFAVYDMAGLEITAKKRAALSATRDPGERHVEIWETLFELGRAGQKSGKGWYRYVNGAREADPEVTALIEEHSRRKGIERRMIAPAEIVERVRAAIVNEAAKCLEEKIAARPSDIDVVLVRGYGFPDWRGGPLFEADQVGLTSILSTVTAMHARDGKGFEPSPLLASLAGQGRTFASLND